jgi:predicted acyltransferase
MADAKPSRWVALDMLRGAAVAGMILVTSPGDWSQAYAPLRHADWNGWTAADMVFPTFLFSVGAALALSFPKPLSEPGAVKRLWGKIAKRALLLILLGLVLNALMEWARSFWMPAAHVPDTVRIPGILQRIALCYVLGAALILATALKDAEGRWRIDARAIGVAIAAILLLYWGLMMLVPVPGFGAGHLDPEGNLAAYIDRNLFTPAHLWWLGWGLQGGPVVYDPEGLLSTLPATANLLFGVLAAVAWQRDPDRALPRIAVAGVALFVAGLLLDPLLPINKRIWTSSFAPLSSGFSAVLLTVLVVASRQRIAERLLAPLRVLGGNAILAFTVSILLGVFGGLPIGGTTPQSWGNRIALGIIGESHLASLACALAITTLITLAIWPLHRRGVHFRL